MSFDGDRVRIELCQVMSVSFGAEPALKGLQAAEVRLSDGAGNILRTRKPAVRLVGESRADLLRTLATWIEQNDDPGLRELAIAYRDAK